MYVLKQKLHTYVKVQDEARTVDIILRGIRWDRHKSRIADLELRATEGPSGISLNYKPKEVIPGLWLALVEGRYNRRMGCGAYTEMVYDGAKQESNITFMDELHPRTIRPECTSLDFEHTLKNRIVIRSGENTFSLRINNLERTTHGVLAQFKTDGLSKDTTFTLPSNAGECRLGDGIYMSLPNIMGHHYQYPEGKFKMTYSARPQDFTFHPE